MSENQNESIKEKGFNLLIYLVIVSIIFGLLFIFSLFIKTRKIMDIIAIFSFILAFFSGIIIIFTWNKYDETIIQIQNLKGEI